MAITPITIRRVGECFGAALAGRGAGDAAGGCFPVAPSPTGAVGLARASCESFEVSAGIAAPGVKSRVVPSERKQNRAPLGQRAIITPGTGVATRSYEVSRTVSRLANRVTLAAQDLDRLGPVLLLGEQIIGVESRNDEDPDPCFGQRTAQSRHDADSRKRHGAGDPQTAPFALAEDAFGDQILRANQREFVGGPR